jgi:N-acetylglucosamine-6-sulfatase
MKKIILPSASVAFVVLLALGLSGSMPIDAQARTAKPNIVFILADDMRKDDLKHMPKTRSVLKNKGIIFHNAFVSTPLCCPSRATIMRGQYAHNSEVWNSRGSSGGWQTYRAKGLERNNVATRLDAAGYRTGLFGKYLNGYKGTSNKPPGWDRWFAHTDGTSYYDYKINDDGTIIHYGSTSADYETDVIADHAKAFIGASAKARVPFFAFVAPKAPHGPYTPPRRDKHAFDGIRAPRPPSFNERDVSDKPPWIRKLPRLSDARKAEIDNRAEKRAETLQALDDLVARMVGKLREKRVLGNTYIFFTSDNGFQMGEHRIHAGKGRPYEGSVRVPLLARGPGVAAGRQSQKLALNTDYLPTFTDLASAQTPGYVDGRSLRPVLKGNDTAWRSAVLLEAHDAPRNTPPYSGIRTSSARKYVSYAGGKKELYHLGHAPYELHNSYDPNSPPATLATRLQALKSCSKDGCRAAENGRSFLLDSPSAPLTDLMKPHIMTLGPSCPYSAECVE